MNRVKRSIVWFRQDLRLHDNEALKKALEHSEEVIPVYVFEQSWFRGKTSYNFPKIGVYRSQFIIEAVEDLRKSLRQLGIDLILRIGDTVEEIFNLAVETQAHYVFANMERTYEENKLQNKLEKKLWTIGKETSFWRGKMLYYTQDLPFPIAHTPDTFSSFRKEVERYTPVREPLEAPSHFKTWTLQVNPGELPTVEDFGHQPFTRDKRSAFTLKGGETAALERLKDYLWERQLVNNYMKTRNGLIGADYSSKLSACLAQGCISPKYIYCELKRYERKVKKNKSTYWLFFELLWRDFFRLMGKRYGTRIFRKEGLLEAKHEPMPDNFEKLKEWIDGKTGVPFIDANMLELKYTGFMSNRGRQNVASYLVKDLKVNWQMGAEYFESVLVDYDVCSNWLNWMYVAGVGNDPRENRYFNPITQAKRYDPKGKYIRLWLPQLRDVVQDGSSIHEMSSRI